MKRLDVLASEARTALDDPLGLPDLASTHDPSGTPLDVRGRAYAIEKLDEIIELLNPTLKAARLSAFKEAITAVQAIQDGFDVPDGVPGEDDEREEFLINMDSEEYGRWAMLDDVLNALQILAHGGNPAQVDRQ